MIVINKTHYEDIGCDIWMKCSLCPLDICIEEVLSFPSYKWVRRMASLAQDSILNNCDNYLKMIQALIEWRECIDRRRFKGRITRQRSSTSTISFKS